VTVKSDAAAFLSGHLAFSQNNVRLAADEFSHALSLNPTNIELMKLAFTSSYYNGDIEAAAQMASQIEKSGAQVAFGSEPALIIAAEQRDWMGMNVLADHLLEDINNQPLGVVMGAWSLALQGQGDAGLTRLLELNHPNLSAQPYALFSQSAKLNEYLGRREDALTVARLAINHDPSNIAVIISMAGVMARQGETAAAIALLDQRLSPFFDRAAIAATLNAGTSPLLTPPNLDNYLAEAVLEASSVRQSNHINLIARLHLARRLAPNNSRITYLLSLGYRDLGYDQRAEAYHQLIPDNSPWKMPSTILKAEHLSQNGENPSQAKVLFNDLTAKHINNASIWKHKGDAARRRNDYATALAAYDRAIALTPNDARLHYRLGMVLDAIDRDDDAEMALRQSLKLDPDDAYALNYLGYLLLEEGGDTNEALSFILSAIEQQPQNGYFMDSLGWGYFKLGQYQQAVTYLEYAVMLEPVDPIMTDHLGDAYFKAGRQREALFQWQRALTIGLEDEERAIIEAKIKQHTVP
jgi:Flp pilus assembly protein TadD